MPSMFVSSGETREFRKLPLPLHEEALVSQFGSIHVAKGWPSGTRAVPPASGRFVNTLRSLNPIPRTAEALGRLLPPFAGSRLRMLGMRLAGFNVGASTMFWGWPTIAGTGDVRALLSIGDFAGFNVRCYFELEDEIRIGNHVSVGHEVMFLTRGFDTGNPALRAGTVKPAPVTIEDGAWLGARSVIMPGVRVGTGAVIGASVVVTEDVPAHTLVMGTQKISLVRWR